MAPISKRLTREDALHHRHGVATRYMGVDLIVHHHRRSLIASTQARDVANANFFCVGALKSGVKSRADLVGSAKMAAHVGAYTHVHLRRGAQVKVRIKARYRMNLTHGNIDFRSKCRKPVGGQVAEIALYGP